MEHYPTPERGSTIDSLFLKDSTSDNVHYKKLFHEDEASPSTVGTGSQLDRSDPCMYTQTIPGNDLDSHQAREELRQSFGPCHNRTCAECASYNKSVAFRAASCCNCGATNVPLHGVDSRIYCLDGNACERREIAAAGVLS